MLLRIFLKSLIRPEWKYEVVKMVFNLKGTGLLEKLASGSVYVLTMWCIVTNCSDRAAAGFWEDSWGECARCVRWVNECLRAYKCVCFVNQTFPPPPQKKKTLPPALLLGGMCGPPPTLDGCANIPDKQKKRERGREKRRTKRKRVKMWD